MRRIARRGSRRQLSGIVSPGNSQREHRRKTAKSDAIIVPRAIARPKEILGCRWIWTREREREREREGGDDDDDVTTSAGCRIDISAIGAKL